MRLLCVLLHVGLMLSRLGRADVVSSNFVFSAEDKVRRFVSKTWTPSRPVQVDGDAVKVYVDVSDAVARLEDYLGISRGLCRITAWVRQQWHDPRLDWSNRTDMNGVSGVRLRPGSQKWTPSIAVLGQVGLSRNLPTHPTEVLVGQTGTVTAVAPVELGVPTGGAWGSNRQYVFTITSLLTDMTFIDLVSRNSTFNANSGDWRVETSIQRREIKRDCCPKPFAALDYTIM